MGYIKIGGNEKKSTKSLQTFLSKKEAERDRRIEEKKKMKEE